MKPVSRLAKIAWVEDYFSLDGYLCGDCKMCEEWKEPHGERMTNCLVLDQPKLYPVDTCPALIEKLGRDPGLVDPPDAEFGALSALPTLGYAVLLWLCGIAAIVGLVLWMSTGAAP